MLKKLAFGLVTAGALALPAQAQAQASVDYCTKLSEADHRNSKGQPLRDAGSILRQDRANFHSFGLRDFGDQTDPMFVTSDARARIPALLAASSTPPPVLRAIVSGTPDVCVSVSGGIMSVSMAAPAAMRTAVPEGRFPFEGRWDCEVAEFNITSSIYDTGGERLAIREIQEGSDGSYTLFFDNGYLITLSGFTGSDMGWFSHASQDNLQCRRMGAPQR
jgi:hypothetical protein